MKNALEQMFNDLVAHPDAKCGPPPVERRRTMFGLGPHPGLVLEAGSVVLLGVVVEARSSIRSVTVVHRGVAHHVKSEEPVTGLVGIFDSSERRFVLEAGDRIECERVPASGHMAIEVEASADARFVPAP